MIRKFQSVALAGALVVAAAPAFAQNLDINPLGLPLVPHSIDLDPLHILTPAPAAAPAAPAAHHHHHHVHHHKK